MFNPHIAPLLGLLFCFPAVAQVTPTALPASVATAVEQARTLLATDTGIDAARRSALADRLELAADTDAQADSELARAQQMQALMADAPAQITALEQELHHDPSDRFDQWRASFDPDAEPEALAAQLTALKTEKAAIAAQSATIAADLAETDLRMGTLAQELDAARRNAELAGQRRSAANPATTGGRIDALAAQAEQRLHLAQTQALGIERGWLPLHSRILELRQRSLQRQTSLSQRKADLVQSALARSTDAELDALDTRLQDEARTTATQSGLLASEAAANLALGQELLASQTALRQTGELLAQTLAGAESASDALRNTQARLALQSQDEAVGLILLNERRRIEPPDSIRQDLTRTRRELAQVQLRLIDLDEQSRILASPDARAQSLLQQSTNISLQADADTHANLRALLHTRAELVTRLETAEGERLAQLAELETALGQQLDVSESLIRLLDRELLWFPSHERLDTAWPRLALKGWRQLFSPPQLTASARDLATAAAQDWPLLAAAGLLFVLLLRNLLRLPQRLATLAQPLMRVRSDRYRYTLQAAAATALGALTWALLPAIPGWLLRQTSVAGQFSHALGSALLTTAGGLFFYQLMRRLNLDQGVAQKHFRWTRPRRDAIAAALPWFLYILLPAQFLLSLAFIHGQEPALDGVVRPMLVLICGIGAALAWRALAPGALWTFRGIADPEPSRARQLLRIGLVSSLASIAVLAVNGYVLTAATLLHSLWLSLLLATSAAIVHGLIARWFLLGERRLALKRLEAGRAEGASVQIASSATQTPAAAAASDPDSESISIQHVNQQTRRLLRAFIATVMIIGLFWVWSGVLPALDRFDSITLWSVSGTGPDGQPLPAVTLAAFLGGALALVLTFIAARNLPGLVELGLLSRIHIDAGTRYAISSISRYLIVIVGLVIGLGLLGVRWSQLQWLAAALTVGLGFGLQEIFANFVSGLIVLFERPYRVGDTITIGEVEGTVSRIRTRATTVVDADNREVVVPNKTFITSRFVNWTLSDTVTRLVFRLGLAQDAEPDKVQAMLLDLARKHPLVLAQPAPGCWFTQISAGSFDFELRLFVAELGHRSRVRSELNRQIAAALAEHDLATSRPATMRIESLLPAEPAPDTDDGA